MPGESANGSIVNIIVKINGSEITPAEYGNLLDVVIDMSFGGPDMITMRFVDIGLEILQKSSFHTFGTSLEVAIGYGDSATHIAAGEITSIEPTFSGSGYSITTVRAMNKLNRLFRGRRTRTFQDQKDSDIVSAIINEAGLSPSVESTLTTHKYVVQWNQTDMEFIQERARRNGFSVWADKDSVYFKEDKNSGSPVVTLTMDENLISFRPRVSLAQQISKVEVRGWDYVDKQAVIGQGTSSDGIDQGGLGTLGSANQTDVVGETPYAIVDHALTTQSEAESIAKSKLKEVNRAFIEGEVEFQGTPEVKPGVLLQLKNVGDIFNGNYFVSYVQHRAGEGQFTTTAGISTADSDRVGRLLNGRPERQIVNGVFPAVVINLNDPDAKNRVQVSFPWMPATQGGDLASFWMRVAVPMAGATRGVMFMPQVGDEVLVAFEGGDPTRGYILGALWNGKDEAPYQFEDGEYKKRGIKTKSGHELVFNEDSGNETITLKDVAGNTMLFDSGNKLIEFTAVKDFKITAQGDITVKANGKIAMESVDTFGIKATGALSMESVQAATLKGLSISIQGNTTVEVKANASLSLSSSGMAELKGTLVKIN